MKSSSKNIGPFLAFDAAWFARHQAALLWLLNTPLVRVWFRWAMCIQTAKKIEEIQPNSITFDRQPIRLNDCWELQQTTEFRTHPKYAKRIYYAFRPLWWTLHFWDWMVADQWLPKLSFGFDSLTAYPAAGANAPVDGTISRANVDESFSTIRAGAGTASNSTNVSGNLIGVTCGSATGLFYSLNRGIIGFDTSGIGTGKSISAATLSLYGYLKNNTIGNPVLHITGASPASSSAIANSDYGNLADTSFGSIGYNDVSTAAYSDITLNSSGQAQIVPTGNTFYGTRSDWDLNNNFTGTHQNYSNAYINCYLADQTAQSNDPKLTVTFSASGGGGGLLLRGVG